MSQELNDTLGTLEVTWKLKDLYSGNNAPELDKDIEQCGKESIAIEKTYSARVAELNDSELLELTTRLEKLSSVLGRIGTYAFLNFTTDIKNQEAAAFLQKIKEIGSDINKHIVFFELELNTISPKKIKKLLKSDLLDHYRHYLESIRRYADHQLSQTEETLLLEIAPVGRSSWTNLFDKVMGHMKFGETGRTEEEVLADLYHADREVRKQAACDLTEGFKSQLHILTHIFNTLLADKMISDRLRTYGSWVRSMNLYNELDDDTVNVLTKTVISRYDIPQRYYEIKRGMLDLPELTDYDRYAPLPDLPETTISWDESKEMVLSSFAEFSPELAEIAQLFYKNNWIHAPILEGKRGGAFAHPCIPEVHPYIMVNYTGNIRDVSTVAHELGHGVHQYLAAEQGYFNSNTPLVLAETASVFAELLLFTSQLGKLSEEKQRKAFICQKLESIFATVFRQIAMNRFEDRAHNARRDGGELSTEILSEHWLTTQRAMFGKSVTLSDDYGIWWSYIPHFLNSPGYVYSYAFGELLVLALYNLYKNEGKSFVPKYLDLLKAGGSRSPYELVKPFGVDLNDPAFWQGGLEIIDDMLTGIER